MTWRWRDHGSTGPPEPVELPPLERHERRVAGIRLLVGQLRLRLRALHYSPVTEKAYVAWLRRFVAFTDRRHPLDVEREVVPQFLRHLAESGVGASTQHQAASALSFLFAVVVGRPLARLPRARTARRVPTVLAPQEVRALLAAAAGAARLRAALMYGAGLRVSECCRLRVADLDFERGQVVVRRGKGAKDRHAPLPTCIVPELREHLHALRAVALDDVQRGIFTRPVRPPTPGDALHDCWLFPGSRLRADRARGVLCRPHLHPTLVQREVATAARAAGLAKPVTCHTLRHSFAVHMLESGVDIRTLQELMGHADVDTTLLYARRPRTLARGQAARSPLDEV